MKKIELTNAEINHLVWLLGNNESTGKYYGNKEKHKERSMRIKNKLLLPCSCDGKRRN